MRPGAESELGVFLGRLGVHQDFFWFTVLLLWSFALIAWWRTEKRTGWRWLPWTAGAGVGSALIAFLVFDPPFDFFYSRLVPGSASNYQPALIDPNLAGDLGLAVATADMLGGWVVVGFALRRLVERVVVAMMQEAA